MKPLLKWCGGKGKLLPEIRKRLPDSFVNYWEPFVGGGAVFFSLTGMERVWLNDTNRDLVAFYNVLGGSPEHFADLLRHVGHLRTPPHCYGGAEAAWRVTAASTYTLIRNAYNQPCLPVDPAFRAAQFLYLNKNSFNGLYRVNAAGYYNTPWGKYDPAKMPTDEDIKEARRALVGTGTVVHISNVDFEEEMRYAEKGDVMYCDPPYLPVSATSFTAYSFDKFSLDDHRRLAGAFRDAAARGVKILLSNADVPLARELYAGFTIDTVQAARSINSDGAGRGKVAEILVSANLP